MQHDKADPSTPPPLTSSCPPFACCSVSASAPSFSDSSHLHHTPIPVDVALPHPTTTTRGASLQEQEQTTLLSSSVHLSMTPTRTLPSSPVTLPRRHASLSTMRDDSYERPLPTPPHGASPPNLERREGRWESDTDAMHFHSLVGSGVPLSLAPASSSSPLSIVATVMYRDALRRHTFSRWRHALHRHDQQQNAMTALADQTYRRDQLRVYWRAWAWRWHFRHHLQVACRRARQFHLEWNVRVTWEAWCRRIRQLHQQRTGVEALLEVGMLTRIEWAWRCWCRWTMRRQLSAALACSSAQCLGRQRWWTWGWRFLHQRRSEGEVGRAIAAKVGLLFYRLRLVLVRQEERRGMGHVPMAIAPPPSYSAAEKKRLTILSSSVWHHHPSMTRLVKEEEEEEEEDRRPTLLLHYLWWHWQRRVHCRRFMHRLPLLRQLQTLQDWRATRFPLWRAWQWWRQHTQVAGMERVQAAVVRGYYFGVWQQWTQRAMYCAEAVHRRDIQQCRIVWSQWSRRSHARAAARAAEVACQTFFSQRVVAVWYRRVWVRWHHRYTAHGYRRAMEAVLAIARPRLLQQLAFRRLVAAQCGTSPGAPVSHETTLPASDTPQPAWRHETNSTGQPWEVPKEETTASLGCRGYADPSAIPPLSSSSSSSAAVVSVPRLPPPPPTAEGSTSLGSPWAASFWHDGAGGGPPTSMLFPPPLVPRPSPMSHSPSSLPLPPTTAPTSLPFSSPNLPLSSAPVFSPPFTPLEKKRQKLTPAIPLGRRAGREAEGSGVFGGAEERRRRSDSQPPFPSSVPSTIASSSSSSSVLPSPSRSPWPSVAIIHHGRSTTTATAVEGHDHHTLPQRGGSLSTSLPVESGEGTPAAAATAVVERSFSAAHQPPQHGSHPPPSLPTDLSFPSLPTRRTVSVCTQTTEDGKDEDFFLVRQERKAEALLRERRGERTGAAGDAAGVVASSSHVRSTPCATSVTGNGGVREARRRSPKRSSSSSGSGGGGGPHVTKKKPLSSHHTRHRGGGGRRHHQRHSSSSSASPSHSREAAVATADFSASTFSASFASAAAPRRTSRRGRRKERTSRASSASSFSFTSGTASSSSSSSSSSSLAAAGGGGGGGVRRQHRRHDVPRHARPLSHGQKSGITTRQNTSPSHRTKWPRRLRRRAGRGRPSATPPKRVQRRPPQQQPHQEEERRAASVLGLHGRCHPPSLHSHGIPTPRESPVPHTLVLPPTPHDPTRPPLPMPFPSSTWTPQPHSSLVASVKSFPPFFSSAASGWPTSSLAVMGEAPLPLAFAGEDVRGGVETGVPQRHPPARDAYWVPPSSSASHDRLCPMPHAGPPPSPHPSFPLYSWTPCASTFFDVPVRRSSGSSASSTPLPERVCTTVPDATHPPGATLLLPRGGNRSSPVEEAHMTTSREGGSKATDTPSNDNPSEEGIQEEMHSLEWGKASVMDLKAYGCRVLRSYMAMKKLANAEEEEQQAVREEYAHWEKKKAWYQTSPTFAVAENASQTLRHMESELDRLLKRSWWLQQRQFRRQQLRARLQQVVVALEAAKQAQEGGGEGMGEHSSGSFSSWPETPMDLSWM